VPCGLLATALLLPGWPAAALESDRQKPLEVNADSTDGTLGDGVTTLRGHVEIRQGTLFIRADEAQVDKADGKVRQVTLRGDTAYLEQEIEEQGMVKAWAELIEYQVANGIVVFTGAAEVEHPQYEVSGEQLRYDLGAQHFEGMGSDSGNGRIRIRLDPEVMADGEQSAPGEADADPQEEPTPDEDPDR
jgi:lipopolysaccharide export system protein LptA